MDSLAQDFIHFLPPPVRGLTWRAQPQDGQLLLFERNSGLNALLAGPETQHLRRLAPRSLLIAVTNACNLTCDFCYRDLKSRSHWTYESLLEFCLAADRWGVLEVAFGGGEPMLFPHWAELINELYRTTNLCLNFTSNGLLLTASFLNAIAGHYGQIRVSLYENNRWADTIRLLMDCNARFGVNWLITPAELEMLETKFLQLKELGVRDFLLLGYKGNKFSQLHLSDADCQRLENFLNKAYGQWGNSMQIKLDICWGQRLANVPRLFAAADCEAGDDFLSITSDRKIKPCSFHEGGIAFNTLDDVKHYWQSQRQLRSAAPLGGCARLPDSGLVVNHAYIPLATI